MNKFEFTMLGSFILVDLFILIEEIPSDIESNIDDYEVEDEEADIQNMNNQQQNLFDIDKIDIFLLDDNESEWDPEDKIPLSQIRTNEEHLKPVWTNSTENDLQKKKFRKECGPIIHLFTNNLIDNMVFQTYALQKNGGNRQAFIPTNSSEFKPFIAVYLHGPQEAPKLPGLLVL